MDLGLWYSDVMQIRHIQGTSQKDKFTDYNLYVKCRDFYCEIDLSNLFYSALRIMHFTNHNVDRYKLCD